MKSAFEKGRLFNKFKVSQVQSGTGGFAQSVGTRGASYHRGSRGSVGALQVDQMQYNLENPIPRQARMMEEVGFTEVDVAWRQDGFFVMGGRKGFTG